jgi:hypothetical protein
MRDPVTEANMHHVHQEEKPESRAGTWEAMQPRLTDPISAFRF